MYQNKTMREVYFTVADAILSNERNSARATEVVSKLATSMGVTIHKSVYTVRSLILRKELSVRTYSNGAKYVSLTKRGCDTIREFNKTQ